MAKIICASDNAVVPKGINGQLARRPDVVKIFKALRIEPDGRAYYSDAPVERPRGKPDGHSLGKCVFVQRSKRKGFVNLVGHG